jgi:hypothetical protein
MLSTEFVILSTEFVIILNFASYDDFKNFMTNSLFFFTINDDFC